MARNLCAARQFCMICIEAAGWHRARFQSGPDRTEVSEHPRIRRRCRDASSGRAALLHQIKQTDLITLRKISQQMQTVHDLDNTLGHLSPHPEVLLG